LKKRTKKLLFMKTLIPIQRGCQSARVFASFFKKKRFLHVAPASLNAPDLTLLMAIRRTPACALPQRC
jgi:hypothetical protein